MLRAEYKKFIEERRAWYKAQGFCYCPALKSNVVFNSKGFNHLLHDGRGRFRPIGERLGRLSLLHHIIPILNSAEKPYRYVSADNSKSKNKTDEYWLFKKVIYEEDILITIVVRRIGGGKHIFYSV
jgi:hypothetical protein